MTHAASHRPTHHHNQHFKSVFAFSESFMAQLRAASDACGFTNFMDTVTFPPKGPIALPPQSFTGTPQTVTRNCRLWDMIFDEASSVNPAFDIYSELAGITHFSTSHEFLQGYWTCGQFSGYVFIERYDRE